MPTLGERIRTRLTRYPSGAAVPPDPRAELIEEIARAVAVAGSEILGRPIGLEERVERRSGNGKCRLALVHTPVRSVSEILLDGSPLTIGDGTPEDATDPMPQVLVSAEGWLERVDGGVFPVGRRNLTITYLAGVAEDSAIGPAVYDALATWGAAAYLELDRLGIATKTIGDTTYSFREGCPKLAREKLEACARRFVPRDGE